MANGLIDYTNMWRRIYVEKGGLKQKLLQYLGRPKVQYLDMFKNRQYNYRLRQMKQWLIHGQVNCHKHYPLSVRMLM